MKGARPMTDSPLSLVEPDMQISRIRLSPESSLPEGAHNATSPMFWR